jgi:methylated-DNA-protein-cysteine methyltransferase related protein
MLSFTERTINIIKNIPRGKVMTYGQIAKYAGSPRSARQVVRILHSMSTKYNLPWHRVINSKGEISFKDDDAFSAQKQFLEDECIIFTKKHVIDLKAYQYHPIKLDEDIF